MKKDNDLLKDEKFEAEFNKGINQIKEELNGYKLSDEFKENLRQKLNAEYYKEEDKINFFNKIPVQKLVATFSCLIILVSGYVAFADVINNKAEMIFNNIDKDLEYAIENGEYQEIDMDYVEDNGVAIKADYIIEEEDALWVAFNIKTEEECEKIYVNSLRINDEINCYFNNNQSNMLNITMYRKRIDKINNIVIYKINNIGYLDKKENFKIEFLEFALQKENSKFEKKNGSWLIELKK